MKAKISKEHLLLIDDCYRNPKTSTLTFCFEPESYEPIITRLRNTKITHSSIEGKDLYLLDRFFSSSESEELRVFSQTASFSRNSYGSTEAIQKGERPARSMNGQERWQFFSNPPKAIVEVQKLLSTLSAKLDARITTLPWELCDESTGSPAVIANWLEEMSEESSDHGKHRDCNPSSKISFGIPILYEEGKTHGPQFSNGALGKPWLISLMLYVTAPNFKPEYQMGTTFYDESNQAPVRVDSQHMRLVLFESDLLHSIEASKIPAGISTWRLSYVFKLIVNPRKENTRVKEGLRSFLIE